jgi:hypothetical protein
MTSPPFLRLLQGGGLGGWGGGKRGRGWGGWEDDTQERDSTGTSALSACILLNTNITY